MYFDDYLTENIKKNCILLGKYEPNLDHSKNFFG